MSENFGLEIECNKSSENFFLVELGFLNILNPDPLYADFTVYFYISYLISMDKYKPAAFILATLQRESPVPNIPGDTKPSETEPKGGKP